MKKISKKTVLNSIYELKEKSNNKLWGLISVFISTNNFELIEGNITYTIESNKLASLLQDLFYFGQAQKEFNSENQIYYRLSNKWQQCILDYVSKDKPCILDFAIFYYKTKSFSPILNRHELVKDFVNELKIPKSILKKLFSFKFKNKELSLVDPYELQDLFIEYKEHFSIHNSNETISFDSPYTIASHPSEFKRAPFIQTLYSGTKIQELILLTDFDLDKYYPSSKQKLKSNSIANLNKIYFGAPGTGKSYKVNELLRGKEKFIERITFHPEYDYGSFVGGYKPITEKDSQTGKEEIKYKFVPQVFTKIYVDAWKDIDSEDQYYLVIEEINRGNCAEIFGDVFQLLDRNPEYKITPSNELKEYFESVLTKNGYQGFGNGKMVLPSNLHILATMNTSDQSLFPMDSAFKRRWDWEYVPIDYKESEDNPSSKFIVKLSDTEDFSWIKFIEKVNKEYIQENPNLGMDKCIGNYFIKAVNNRIELSDFINKAIFYLWNDVFKDEERDEENIFDKNTFYENFFPISENGEKEVAKILMKIGLKAKED